MKIPIFGGPRDGDFEVIGDRTEDRDGGRMYVFEEQAYMVEPVKGAGPRLKWLSPWPKGKKR